MTTQNPLPLPRNRLWLARKNLGLEQKQVALLLGHRTTDQIYRYEKGLCLPSLKTLLQLEIIYGLPARELYPNYYEQLAQKILQKAAGNASLQGKLSPLPERYCFYIELQNKESLTEDEQTAVDQHAMRLMRRRAGIRKDLSAPL